MTIAVLFQKALRASRIHAGSWPDAALRRPTPWAFFRFCAEPSRGKACQQLWPVV